MTRGRAGGPTADGANGRVACACGLAVAHMCAYILETLRRTSVAIIRLLQYTADTVPRIATSVGTIGDK